VLVLAVCDVLFLLQGDTQPVKGSLFALTYTANYALVLHPDSVAGFGPTWSLAVEEHFYVVWPLALLLVTRRWGLRGALRATVAVCVFAVLWRGLLVLADVYSELVAIGSLERADAMLWGCAAALALRLGWRPPVGSAWAGLAIVACLPLYLADSGNAALVFGNAVLAVAGTALVVGLDYGAPGPLQRVLSLRPVVRLGVLSYGVYLWHGPLMRVAANGGFEGRGWRAVVGASAVGFAAASYHWVEAPVRAWVRRRTSDVPAVAVGSHT
jgi:peptidoglycan/LPS O-acetylase OafA/YrhL